jgi:hypothetical protein
MTDGTPVLTASGRRPSRRRVVAIAVVVGWSMIISGLAWYSVLHGRPTAPEQTSLAAAVPAVDAVLGDVIVAVDPARTVVTVGGFRRISGDCRITAARSGSRYQRTLTAYPADGDGSNLLETVAAALPARYSAHVTKYQKTTVLTAADDRFAPIRGEIDDGGRVQLTVETACRSGRFPTQPVQDVAAAPPAPSTAVQTAFGALGVAPGRWSAVSAACAGGGSLWTVQASASSPSPASPSAAAQGTAAQSAAVRLSAAVPSGGGVLTVVDHQDLVAFRAGQTAAVVRRSEDSVTVAATVGCA